MNIEFERTIDDVIDFNLFHITHSSSIKRQLLLMRVLTSLLVIPLVLGLPYFIYNLVDIFAIIISILAGILIFTFYPFLIRRATINRIHKMLNEGNNKTLLGHQTISFSPEGIFCKNQSTESKINRSAIDKVVQSEKHFFLYTSSINALVIPKSCFQSKEDQRDLLEHINAYLWRK